MEFQQRRSHPLLWHGKLWLSQASRPPPSSYSCIKVKLVRDQGNGHLSQDFLILTKHNVVSVFIFCTLFMKNMDFKIGHIFRQKWRNPRLGRYPVLWEWNCETLEAKLRQRTCQWDGPKAGFNWQKSALYKDIPQSQETLDYADLHFTWESFPVQCLKWSPDFVLGAGDSSSLAISL